MSAPLRVLLVEDEAAILMQLEALFEDLGHEVVATAMSSNEAIALLAETAPDLVFLDLQLLDGFTGINVARHIGTRQAGRPADRNPRPEVVFMTANVSRVADDLDHAIGVLAKPVSRTALGATVRYLAECLRTPPPTSDRPAEFVPTPAFAQRISAFTSV
jgi:two-component system, response regulator PdtaR